MSESELGFITGFIMGAGLGVHLALRWWRQLRELRAVMEAWQESAERERDE